ncbi:Ribonuclease III [Gloeomargarita lithophora Alchichica-D10]|uniref:Ribonuclease 3 n=1 Tax=Gloeomargarita lithophora Alchichica-D10 TaxID=1188229 RepID=A0A1J0ABS7_9CYAN|nr:ribonuclease III [Gloeomargarita lithophora]APB33353.1 Ribonuclease III [Gloeomargarita lithophora Alchichica-D10]
MAGVPPGSRRYNELQKLLQRLSINPAKINWHLLDQALTHSSFDPQCNYEPLEFVGDGVLRLLAADYLWHHYPQTPVGEYTALRSVLVSNRLLRQMSQEYGLGEFILAATRLSSQGAWLADILEAVVGAIYLSLGSANVLQPCFYPHWNREAQRVLQDPARLNYKNALQEWTQEHYKILPIYETESLSGTPERFMARVYVQKRLLGVGQGESIKAAQQAAAQQAWGVLAGDAGIG